LADTKVTNVENKQKKYIVATSCKNYKENPVRMLNKIHRLQQFLKIYIFHLDASSIWNTANATKKFPAVLSKRAEKENQC